MGFSIIMFFMIGFSISMLDLVIPHFGLGLGIGIIDSRWKLRVET